MRQLMETGCRPRCGHRIKFARPDGRANGIVSVNAEQSYPRVHAMDGASLVDEAFGQKEDEETTKETAKIICSGDAAKIRQLGVDLDFPKVTKSGLVLSRWMSRIWDA